MRERVVSTVGFRARQFDRAGWLLPGLILLISAVLLALGAITVFLTQHLRLASLRQQQAKALYLAQSGVMQAIHDFRFDDSGISGTDNGFRLGEYAVPTDTGVIGSYADDDVFILGGQAADVLLVNMIAGGWATANICGSPSNRQRLQAWTIRNVLLTDSTAPTAPDNLPDGMLVVIDRLMISWNPDNGERVYRIDLLGNNNTVYNDCAGLASGQELNITNQTVAPSSEAVNRIWFSRRTTENSPPTLLMTNKNWIDIRFIMTDNSVRRVRFLPATPLASSVNFTVKSVGEVRKGPFPFQSWRRLQAEYRLDDADATPSLNGVGNITTDTALLTSPSAPLAEQRPGYQELSQKQP